MADVLELKALKARLEEKEQKATLEAIKDQFIDEVLSNISEQSLLQLIDLAATAKKIFLRLPCCVALWNRQRTKQQREKGGRPNYGKDNKLSTTNIKATEPERNPTVKESNIA